MKLIGVRPLAIAAAMSVLGLGAAACDSPPEIRACASDSDGALRVIADGAECQAGEHLVTWNQQGPPGPAGPTGTVAMYKAVPDEASTTSSTPVSQGGPAITVTVPEGGLIDVKAITDLRITANGNGCANAYILTGLQVIPIASHCDAGYVRNRSAGASFEFTPGTQRTFSLGYAITDSTTGASAFFRNRKLWVSPVLTTPSP